MNLMKLVFMFKYMYHIHIVTEFINIVIKFINATAVKLLYT